MQPVSGCIFMISVRKSSSFELFFHTQEAFLLDVLKHFLNNGFELATVPLEMALCVYTVWNHGVSRICGFLPFVKLETLLAIFPRYYFFSLYSFSSFSETPVTDVRDTGTILILGPLSQFSSLLFTLDNFYWSIHFYFWFRNLHLDLLYHFYFPIEIVHLSTHFKIFFPLGILY